MSGRSLAHSAIAVCGVVACGARVPEADPDAVTKLFARMVEAVPSPGGVAECAWADLASDGATLTRRTFYELARAPLSASPTNEPWVNPHELDSPAARVLLDSKDDSERRRAAAELLSASSFLVYHNELIDVPLALGVKDFKKGYAGARALRYDKSGKPVCFRSFVWTSTPAKKAWAIEVSDRPRISDEVRDEMRRDLRAQMIARIANLASPPQYDPNEPADDRHDRQ
jgi:hypothetical protein